MQDSSLVSATGKADCEGYKSKLESWKPQCRDTTKYELIKADILVIVEVTVSLVKSALAWYPCLADIDIDILAKIRVDLLTPTALVDICVFIDALIDILVKLIGCLTIL